MIAHNVYFTLRDNSEAAIQMLFAACRKYLAEHPGIVSFACGALAIYHTRDVNDRDWTEYAPRNTHHAIHGKESR